ncbi:MAG: hypothetical protein D6815_10985 [Candidatus Dadabacteria bacterium]|nr:MAG: hypothetical protein D6815_10985 [Candidatus Dadabacteria bacterium]
MPTDREKAGAAGGLSVGAFRPAREQVENLLEQLGAAIRAARPQERDRLCELAWRRLSDLESEMNAGFSQEAPQRAGSGALLVGYGALIAPVGLLVALVLPVGLVVAAGGVALMVAGIGSMGIAAVARRRRARPTDTDARDGKP